MESQGKKVDTSRLNYQLRTNSKRSDDRSNKFTDQIYLLSRYSARDTKEYRQYEHILFRIGESSNPGPSHKGCHSKQRKLGTFFHQHHTKKDDKDMWYKEK
eukprot:13688643-Heterocapsa_arctica.AAC.1